MSIINTGKSFANGEQLTAAKLNQVITDASFNSGAVDNSTISIDTSGKLAVNQITSSNIANNAIGLSDLAQVSTNNFLGRTSAGSGNVESIGISTLYSLIRPKTVVPTGATLALTLQDQSGNKVYNIADFTSDDTDFATNKIIGVIVQGYVRSVSAANEIQVTLPKGNTTRIARVAADGTNDDVQVSQSFTVPVDVDTTSITFNFEANDTTPSLYNEIKIKGLIIIPAL
jgi:hypothetical protein